MTKSKLKTWKR